MRRLLTRIGVLLLCLWPSLGLSVEKNVQEYQPPVVLQARQEVVLSSQMAGKIDKIYVKEGHQFKKGQVLISFDCAINHAELEKAQAKWHESAVTFASNTRLNRLNAVSKSEVEKSKAELATAVAEKKIKQHLVSYCQITAPFNGQVFKTLVKPHQSVEHNTPLIEILDNRHLRLEIIVPSKWLSWLHVGSKFTVSITETGQSYSAIVTELLPRVDSVSQTIRIYGQIEGEHPRLIAGMSGHAIFRQHN